MAERKLRSVRAPAFKPNSPPRRRRSSANQQVQQQLLDRIEDLRIEIAMHSGLAEGVVRREAVALQELQEARRLLTIAEAQGDYLIGTCNRLLDRHVGTQLSHGLSTIDQAVPFVAGERLGIERELLAIKAKHAPVGDEGDGA